MERTTMKRGHVISAILALIALLNLTVLAHAMNGSNLKHAMITRTIFSTQSVTIITSGGMLMALMTMKETRTTWFHTTPCSMFHSMMPP